MHLGYKDRHTLYFTVFSFQITILAIENFVTKFYQVSINSEIFSIALPDMFDTDTMSVQGLMTSLSY